MALKVLVVLPCFRHGWILRQTIKRWGGADMFVIQDNSEEDIIEVLNENNITPNIITNEDWYVNKCWNAGMKYFLESDYDLVCLATMDTWISYNWKAILEKNYSLSSNEIILPDFVDQNLLVQADSSPIPLCERIIRTAGTGNFATFFNRKAIELFYPIPDEIKLWYGDDWMFTILREAGFKTSTFKGLYAHQFGSITVSGNDKANEIIQHDKSNWDNSIKSKMIERINNNLKQST